MKSSSKIIRATLIVMAAIGPLFYPLISYSAMSSTNFRIDADSFDVGGIHSSSSAFTLDDSISGSPFGTVTSTSFELRGGFQSMSGNTLSLSISNSSVALGTLSASAVASGSTVATVVTDADTGYTLSVGSVSGAGLTGVSDGTVTAGAQEYGVAVAGGDRLFNNDRAVAASLALAASNVAVASSATTLTFKAAISTASTAATYNQTITLTASANF